MGWNNCTNVCSCATLRRFGCLTSLKLNKWLIERYMRSFAHPAHSFRQRNPLVSNVRRFSYIFRLFSNNANEVLNVDVCVPEGEKLTGFSGEQLIASPYHATKNALFIRVYDIYNTR